MGNDTKAILCGRCKVALEGPADPGPNDTVRCPRCGVTEQFQKVTAELGDFLTDHASAQLSDSIKRQFRGSKHIKVTTKPVKKRHHRFIIDM